MFFGREQHTQQLLERLAKTRFVAVVGTSGSGKSSLVRAGLLPALYRGYLVGATSRWRIAVMRPGSAPIENLAVALASQAISSYNPTHLQAALRRTSLGLVDTVREAGLAEGESLLIVVDQFEELFRFHSERRTQDGGAEAALFADSLLEAADSFNSAIHVILTMRSEFIGECAQFPGLPAALNRGQYLIPCLNRDQRRAAIEKHCS